MTRRRPRVASGAAGDERPAALAAINTNGGDGTAGGINTVEESNVDTFFPAAIY